MAHTRREITALMSMRPAEANRLRDDGTAERVSAASLLVGDRVLVRPGERLPADGVVLEGRSAVNQAAITGESIPVDKAPDQAVYAGTINGNGPLVVQVDRAPEETVLARIIRIMVQGARDEKPKTALFIERFERTYSRAIVAAAFLMTFLPPLLLDWTLNESVYRALILVVAAAPCRAHHGGDAYADQRCGERGQAGRAAQGRPPPRTAGRRPLHRLRQDRHPDPRRAGVTDVVALNGHAADELLALAAGRGGALGASAGRRRF